MSKIKYRIKIDGKHYQGLKEISKKTGINEGVLNSRIQKGYSLEKAISFPIRKKISINIEGKEYFGWTEISKKIGISDSLLRLRVTKLGWSLEEAVKLPANVIKTSSKKILFRGITYRSQEEFTSKISKESPFSKTTLKIKLAKLKIENPNYTEKDLEDLVFGKNKIIDNGGFLYLISSKITGKQYVGITIRNIEERWKAHKSECNDDRIQSPLKNEMRKFGHENFIIEVIAKVTNSKQLKKLEKEEITSRNTIFPHGLNANIGGTLGARDTETFEFEGTEYRSLTDLARDRGIEPGTLRRRLNQYGMSLEEAVYFEKDLSFEWNGKNYINIISFCKEMNLSYQRFISLRHAGYTLDEIVQRLKEDASCPVCGSKFKKKSSIHKFCSSECKWKWKYKNPKKEEGRCSSNGNRRAIKYQDKEYLSVSEFCRLFNLNRSAFSRFLIKTKYNVEEALNYYKNRKSK